MKSVLRRASRPIPEPTENIDFRGLHLDMQFKTCSVEGKLIKLTRKELEVLILLIKNKGKIFSREEILAKIWPEEVVVLDRTIDVNITRLRQKLGSYGQYIITRSGYGYGFKEE